VKGEVMKIHPSVNPALWGATAGAVALAIIGFSWGGWVTGGSAQRSADNRASSSVVAALAPICLTQFQQKSDSVMQLAALKKVPSYEQSSFVEKAGWATMPGSTEPTAGVAKACATLIANLK
jgi:alpha/beta superfamily hydrolase